MDKRSIETLSNFQDTLDQLKRSNPTAQLVKQTHIKIIVADPRWQRIRSALVGKWKTRPIQAINILRLYLGNGKDPIKVRQVLNYLTGSAFRMGVIQYPELDELLDDVRRIWSNLLKK